MTVGSGQADKIESIEIQGLFVEKIQKNTKVIA